MNFNSLDLKSIIMLALVLMVIVALFRNYLRTRKKMKRLDNWIDHEDKNDHNSD